MRATIENLSPLPRTHWCQITFPRNTIASLPEHCSFVVDGQHRRWRAVKGRTIGSETVVYVQADIDGHETVTGSLDHSVLVSTQAHRMHPWVADDIGKLVLQAGVCLGGHYTWTQLAEWKLLFTNPAVQRWWTRALGPHGLILEVWADVWSDTPVIDFYAKVVWSDRTDPSWNAAFEGVWLKSGEALALDFATAHGIVGGAKNIEGLYVYLLGRDLGFTDGSALPISGSMLCFRDRPDNLSEAQIADAIRNLYAASGAPVFGIALPGERGGEWLARGNIARSDPNSLRIVAANEWNRFASMTSSFRGWYAYRPVGCTSTPAQTGSQEDFGATKGTFAVALAQPRHIYRLRYAVQSDLFRGCQHYEDGKPLDLSRHPRWVSLAMVTHYHTGVSQDRLGKDGPRPPATGWAGYDAQHRSQNNLAAYLALHDDPLMKEHCEHMLTTDFADYRRRFPQNGADSARGQGRPVGTWAQLLKVTGNERFAELINHQTAQSYGVMMGLGNGATMRVLSTILDARYPLMINNELARCVSTWEHGLALVGFYLAHHVMPINAWRDRIIDELVLLLARHALHEDTPNVFRLATAVHWNNGDAPLGFLWDNGSGVGGWTRAGLVVAREWLADKPDHADLHDKVQRYLLSTLEDPTPDLGWAEWWAIANPIL